MRLVLVLLGYGLDLQIGRVAQDEEEDETEESEPIVSTGTLVAGPEPLGFVPHPPTYSEE